MKEGACYIFLLLFYGESLKTPIFERERSRITKGTGGASHDKLRYSAPR